MVAPKKNIFRLYFNRSKDFPYIWSFDTGTQQTEHTVTEFKGHINVVGCGYNPNVKNPDTEPKAWIIIESGAAILNEDGSVTFY